MQENSFTSNSKKRSLFQRPVVTAFLIIVAIELTVFVTGVLHFYTISSTETWKQRRVIASFPQGRNLDAVILGDSTVTPLAEFYNDPSILVLATYTDTTMAGFYFLLRDLYQRETSVTLCCIVAHHSLWRKDFKRYEAAWAASGYFFNPFASWKNVYDLAFGAKRFDLAALMAGNILLPSLRLKHGLVGELFKRNIIRQPKQYRLSRQENIRRSVVASPLIVSHLAEYYFERIVEECRAHNTKIIVVESYLPATRFHLEEDRAPIDKNIRTFLLRYPDVVIGYYGRRFIFEDAAFRRDGAHLKNTVAIKQFAKAVGILLENTLTELRRQRERNAF